MQVVTGDSWASVVTRSLFPPGETSGAISFFFVSYVIVAGTVLLNVVLTVLLDEFLKAVAAEKAMLHEQVCVCVCMCVRACACVRCVRCVCVRERRFLEPWSPVPMTHEMQTDP